MKNLDQPNFFQSNQNWTLKQHFEHEGHKLRFIIKRNAYENQSSAVVQVQDKSNMSWNGLGSIPYPQMRADGSYVLRELSVKQKQTFFADLEALKEIAFMLI